MLEKLGGGNDARDGEHGQGMPPYVASTSLIARRSQLYHAVGRSAGVVRRLRWGHQLLTVCEDMEAKSHARHTKGTGQHRSELPLPQRPASAPGGRAGSRPSSRSGSSGGGGGGGSSSSSSSSSSSRHQRDDRRQHGELDEKLQRFLRRRDSLSGAGMQSDRGCAGQQLSGAPAANAASQRQGLEQRLARYAARGSPAAQSTAASYSPARGRGTRGADIEISQHAYGTGLNYGAEIALESSQGRFLQLDGALTVSTSAKQIRNATRFTIYSTVNRDSLGEVRYGDCVRLEVCNARRLGQERTKGQRIPQLLGVRIDGKHVRPQDQQQQGAARWAPTPVVLPCDPLKKAVRGRWVIRNATGLAEERQHSREANSVVHLGPVVLEQDWGYLSSTNDQQQTVELRKRGDPDVGVCKGERELPKLHSGGVWKVHLCSALTTKVGRKRQALLEARKQIQSVQDGAASHRRFPVKLNQNRQNYKQQIAERQQSWEVAKEEMFEAALHDKYNEVVAQRGASALGAGSARSSPASRGTGPPRHARSRSPVLEARTQRMMGVITDTDAVAHLSTLGGCSAKYADGTMARETLAGLGLTDPYSFSVLERAARNAVEVRMGSQLVDLPHTVAGRRSTAAKLIQRTYRKHMDKPLLRKFLQEDISVSRELLEKNRQIERQREDALALEEERKLNVMRSSGMNKAKQGAIRVTHRYSAAVLALYLPACYASIPLNSPACSHANRPADFAQTARSEITIAAQVPRYVCWSGCASRLPKGGPAGVHGSRHRSGASGLQPLRRRQRTGVER